MVPKIGLKFIKFIKRLKMGVTALSPFAYVFSVSHTPRKYGKIRIIYTIKQTV